MNWRETGTWKSGRDPNKNTDSTGTEQQTTWNGKRQQGNIQEAGQQDSVECISYNTIGLCPDNLLYVISVKYNLSLIA